MTGKRWMKAEMHAHCNLDPRDYGICGFSPQELIQEASGKGFEILSITCHDLDIWTPELADYARDSGITLVPGMEVTAEKTRHILVYNFRKDAKSLNTLDKIRINANEGTLVVAPHPFYPGRSCLRGLLEKNLDLFDAVEYSGFLVRGLDFNRRGIKLAKRNSKTVVGFGDIHFLWQLGKTYTWIYAEPNVESITASIKSGWVRIEASPLSWFEAAGWWAGRFWRSAFPVNSPAVPLSSEDFPPSPPATERNPIKNAYPETPSDKIEDGRCFGTPQESVKAERIHVGH
jgi:hypothetical protein